MRTCRSVKASAAMGVGITALVFGVMPMPAVADSSGYLALLNAERAAHGLPALTERSDLDAIATAWSAHMAAVDLLSHNPRLADVVQGWQAVGENVGEGPTIGDLDSAFMGSAEHRANILDPTYNDVGIGVARGDGVIWITVDFRDPEHSSSPSLPHTSAGSAAVATTPTALPRTGLLQQGDVGRSVARLQARLHVRADGRYGAKTRGAVIRFQRRYRLRVDGIAGPQTMAELRRIRHAQRRPRMQICDRPGASAACST